MEVQLAAAKQNVEQLAVLCNNTRDACFEKCLAGSVGKAEDDPKLNLGQNSCTTHCARKYVATFVLSAQVLMEAQQQQAAAAGQ